VGDEQCMLCQISRSAAASFSQECCTSAASQTRGTVSCPVFTAAPAAPLLCCGSLLSACLLTACLPALLQALLRAFELEPFALVTSHFIGKTCITLMAGSAILQFIANTITAHGIGNGTTLVIVTSIVSGGLAALLACASLGVCKLDHNDASCSKLKTQASLTLYP
jgi:hypothetical protein